MPTVHVNIWKGFEQEKINYLIENLTKVFVDLDIPAEAVHIIFTKSHNLIGVWVEYLLQKGLRVFIRRNIILKSDQIEFILFWAQFKRRIGYIQNWAKFVLFCQYWFY